MRKNLKLDRNIENALGPILAKQAELHETVLPLYSKLDQRRRHMVALHLRHKSWAKVAEEIGLSKQGMDVHVNKYKLTDASKEVSEHKDVFVDVELHDILMGNVLPNYRKLTDPSEKNKTPPAVQQKANHDILEATGIVNRWNPQGNTPIVPIQVNIEWPDWKKPDDDGH